MHIIKKKYLIIFLLFSTVIIILFKQLNSKSGDYIKLAKPVTSGKITLEEAINSMRSIRRYSEVKLTMEDVSQLLWAAGGEKVDTVTSASRTYPSAGAVYPLEFYLVAGNVEGIVPGLYHYISDNHTLNLVCKGDIREKIAVVANGQSMIKNSPAAIIITADYERVSSRYGSNGKKYVHMDSGHAGQNIYLMAAARKIGTVAIGAFRSSDVKKIMNLPDNEIPVYIFPVGYPI